MLKNYTFGNINDTSIMQHSKKLFQMCLLSVSCFINIINFIKMMEV